METLRALGRFALLSLVVGSSVGCGDDPFFGTDPVHGPPGNPAADASCEKPCRLADKTPGYPTCGCGTQSGNLIDDYEFQGKNAASGGVAAPKQTIRLGDFFDPDGKKGNRFLVLSVSALWCVACKNEATQLPALHAKYGSKGVVFMTDLMQSASPKPSTDTDLDLWIKSFKLDTWVVRDDLQVLASFFDPSQMPLNMIIDLKTMQMVKVFIGASLDKIESELDSRL
jgi:hypothetical protein